MFRRTALALFAAGLLIGVGPAMAAPVSPIPSISTSAEMSMGSPKAKVTVIEWGSVTCPHCARFNSEVFPAFKKKYVDTGKVRFVFRELPTPPVGVAVAGFLIARCAGPDKYFAVTDDIFKSQPEIYAAADAQGNLDSQKIMAVLARVATKAGLNQGQFEACLSDEAAAKAMDARVNQAADVDKITSTPTFQVGETKVAGVQTLAQLDALIEPLLKKK